MRRPIRWCLEPELGFEEEKGKEIRDGRLTRLGMETMIMSTNDVNNVTDERSYGEEWIFGDYME